MRLVLVTCALMVTSCFPQLPDPLVVDDLRVLAIQVDPATALLSSFPLPIVTVRALTVDPEDPEGEGIEHRWALELGDEDFEGREELESLIPDDVSGPTLQVDFAASTARDEVQWALGRLPISYIASNEDLARETIKIVDFLTPEVDSAGDDDDSAGDDDDSAGEFPGDDDDSAAGFPGDGPPPGSDDFPVGDDDSSFPGQDGFPGAGGDSEVSVELPEDWNANPRLTRIERVGGDTWSTEEGSLTGPLRPIYVGDVSPDTGQHLRIEVEDDQPTTLLTLEFYRTTGRAGLPDPEEEDSAEEDRENAENFGNGDSPVLDDELTPREFGWTPFQAGDDREARLFLVVRDREGGQTWQEILPQDAPPKWDPTPNL